MVGVGWLVVMDDWLLRGGALGAVLGFAIGGAMLLPVGYVYARLVKAIPDASGEVAYTAKVFPQSISYATGWMMVLSYFIVCPWEAVAVGKIAAYIFPALDSMEIYRIAERPVYLPHLLIGLGLTGLDHVAQLPRRSPQRHVSELDNLRNAGALRRVRQRGRRQGCPAQLSALVHAWRVCLCAAGAADRALFHDRIRVGGQSGGGSQSGTSRAAAFSPRSGWRSWWAFSFTPSSSLPWPTSRPGGIWRVKNS